MTHARLCYNICDSFIFHICILVCYYFLVARRVFFFAPPFVLLVFLRFFDFLPPPNKLGEYIAVVAEGPK